MPLRVVVTGGAGFIGSHVVDSLLARDADVVAIDSFDPYYDPRIKWDNIVAARRNPRFRLVTGDIRDLDTIDSALGDAPSDAIIHLAAAVGVRPSIAEPARYVRMNVEGTAAALKLAERRRIGSFLLGSSSSVYGETATVPFVENDPAVSPISPYAATKRAAELLCHSAHQLSGLSVMCLRFFTVYGPRQRPDLAIHRFVSKIEEEVPVTIYGNGHTTRDYTHVSDIVAGVSSALEYVRTRRMFEIVNLGGGQPVTVIGLVALLEKLLGKKALIEWLPDQEGDVRQTHASIAKASDLLNFKPAVDIEQGLGGFVEWYRRLSSEIATR
jgi:UDP-glucuronate 4-epimerase